MTVAEERTHPTEQEQVVAAKLDELLRRFPPATTPAAEFLGAQFDMGLAWVHFPVGYGGLDLPRELAQVVMERLVEAGAPLTFTSNGIGYWMGAPTVLTLGSEQQKARYLRPLFTCEDIWCQLFSEPGAGSDVAGLSTRAVRDGDEWVVNGQKVWTTNAKDSRFGLLIARTDPEADKHKGLTYFVVDMHAPGVEVRPLRQMTGDAEFNEVYFTDVRIPDSERLTEVGEGWRGVLVTLMNERFAIGSVNVTARGAGAIKSALELWEKNEAKNPVDRDQLARLWIEAEVQRLTTIRAAANAQKGTPGPETSIGKLAWAELNQRIREFCINTMGPYGQLYGSYEMSEDVDRLARMEVDPHWAFVRAAAHTLEGGTSEVMRNIIGERVLGLPGDIRADKDRPWSQVPRS